MKVKELRKILKEFDEDLDVLLNPEGLFRKVTSVELVEDEEDDSILLNYVSTKSPFVYIK